MVDLVVRERVERIVGDIACRVVRQTARSDLRKLIEAIDLVAHILVGKATEDVIVVRDRARDDLPGGVIGIGKGHIVRRAREVVREGRNPARAVIGIARHARRAAAPRYAGKTVLAVISIGRQHPQARGRAILADRSQRTGHVILVCDVVADPLPVETGQAACLVIAVLVGEPGPLARHRVIALGHPAQSVVIRARRLRRCPARIARRRRGQLAHLTLKFHSLKHA